jgi:hypothetical protein
VIVRPQSNAPTILALLGLLAAAGGLLGLTALVIPQALGLIAVVVGLFAYIAIHYLLWGWWMRPVPFTDDEANADSGRSDRGYDEE